MTPLRILTVVALLALSIGAGRTAGSTFGAFSATTVNPSTMSAKAVFPATRSWSAWDLRDASGGGAEVNASDPEAFTGLTVATKASWQTTFAANRYLTYDMNGPLPAGISASGVAFNFDFADATNGATSTMCFFFEVLRRSTGTVIGTHGSAAAPVACEPTTTIRVTSTPLPEVTTSDIANDLRVRVFMSRSRANRAATIDRATVSGTTSVAPFTLYETSSVDAADTVPATTPWPIATADAAARQTSANWATAFSATRYLKATFPSYLPASATVTSAQLVHVFRPTTATATACFYLDVLQGATVLATYGSAASPFCATGAGYTTNTIALPVLNTAARVNGAIVRMYVRTTNGGSTQHDHFRLDVGYAVD